SRTGRRRARRGRRRGRAARWSSPSWDPLLYCPTPRSSRGPMILQPPQDPVARVVARVLEHERVVRLLEDLDRAEPGPLGAVLEDLLLELVAELGGLVVELGHEEEDGHGRARLHQTGEGVPELAVEARVVGRDVELQLLGDRADRHVLVDAIEGPL